jgi:AcrR family transcriptional regulator
MLETAGRVFAARGFREASMDEIAEAAGISKPMLYSYFGSKEGLYFAFVNLAYREVIVAIDTAVTEAIAAGGRAEQQLRAGTRAYYRYVSEHRDGFRVLFREMGDAGGHLAEQRHRLHKRVSIAIAALLEDAEMPPPEPETASALAEAWLSTARALADWWLDHSGRSPEDMEHLLMDLMLHGLLGRDSRPPGRNARTDA